jgi:hypothetical protein
VAIRLRVVLPRSCLEKPIKNLDELELVIEIMFEPEDHFLKVSEVSESPIASFETAKNLALGPPADSGQELGANRA